ncbi:MAG: hypothetical protein Pars92KO_12280 [Parasphingorhabdus sp.]
MEPSVLGEKYDKIAQWWNDRHNSSSYGVEQFKRAIGFAPDGGSALDVGCGAGGRFIRILQSNGYKVTGLDVSKEMIRLASQNHPEEDFIHQDINSWETSKKFDFIVAWDSIFHLPLDMQKPVLTKLCQLLNENGVLIYTFGDGSGGGESEWCNDTFYYSTIGITENIRVLLDNGLSLMHMELDQYPETHVYVIAVKQLR